MSIRLSADKLLGALFSMWWTGVVIGLLCLVIPSEAIPRVEQLPNGNTAYYVQSLRGVIFPPLALFLAVVFAVVYVRYFSSRADARRAVIPRVDWKRSDYLSLGCLFAVACFCTCGLVFLPLTEIRRVVLEQHAVSFDGLCTSRRASRLGIGAVRINHVPHRGRARASVRLSLHVTTAEHGTIEIACGKYGDNDPDKDKMVELLGSLKERLSDREQ